MSMSWLKRSVLPAILLATFALAGYWFCHTRYGAVKFVNPVAYTVIGDRLYVLEKKDNRLLELTYAGAGRPLHLRSAAAIEPDDPDYFYMVRKLYPGPDGRLVTHSYVYDRNTRSFAGYRFRAYDPGGREPPREILRVLYSDPARYPEMRYACDRTGDHYFVNTCEGEFNIWKLPAAAAGMLVRDHPGAGIIALGETNNAWAGWNSIQVDTAGRIFLACGSAGRLVEYGPDGRRRRDFGEVRVEPGGVLAPDDLTFVTLNPGAPPALTIASTGNRTWLQFDHLGRRIRLLNPLAEGYPFADIMVGGLFPHPALGACAFDLVNRCLVIPGPPLRVVEHYRASCRCGVCVILAGGLALAGLWLAVCRLRRRLDRIRFPLFLKLLLLFVPLVLAGNLMVESQVREMMRADKEQEAVLRLANLARAILNTVALDDLEAIRQPADRNSPVYERIYLAVTRILDAQRVPHTPKWILHKIANHRFYFGINIWRGPIFEPFIVTPERDVFLRAVAEKTSQYGRFQDDQGEWFSHISPILNRAGEVIYLLELYRPTETMDRADREAAARARRMVEGTGLLLFLVILVFSYLFTRPLRRLMHATEIISAGGFEHRIALRSRDELGDLALAFNQMAGRLADFTAEQARAASEKERIQSELRFAREMQRDLLPTVFPPYAGLENIEIVARMEPAREIGGDYFDFFPVDADHLGVVVADVAGKGVPAGLFLMEFRTLLRSFARGRREAAPVIRDVNRMLAEDNPSVMFVTVFYLVCNLRTGHVVYCNAGHPPPFYRPDAAWQPLAGAACQGMAVGVEAGAVYQDSAFDLPPGAMLLLYSDGVTEAPDRTDRMFGEEGISRSLNVPAAAAPAALVDALMRSVSAHQTGREQFDDITVLALQFHARK